MSGCHPEDVMHRLTRRPVLNSTENTGPGPFPTGRVGGLQSAQRTRLPWARPRLPAPLNADGGQPAGRRDSRWGLGSNSVGNVTSKRSPPFVTSATPVGSICPRAALAPRWPCLQAAPVRPCCPRPVPSGQGAAGIGTNQAPPQAASARCPHAGHRGDSGPRVPSGRQAGPQGKSPAARGGPASVGNLSFQGRWTRSES